MHSQSVGRSQSSPVPSLSRTLFNGAKICSDGAHRSESPLLEEYDIYQTLRDLQGSAIPRCYGLFRLGDFADMLLLEDCGESLRSFDGRSTD
jgi:hypothetical protein